MRHSADTWDSIPLIPALSPGSTPGWAKQVGPLQAGLPHYSESLCILTGRLLFFDIRLTIEAECSRWGFSFSAGTIGKIMSDPSLRVHFNDSLRVIHQRLAL